MSDAALVLRARRYDCSLCGRILMLTPPNVLVHRSACALRQEQQQAAQQRKRQQRAAVKEEDNNSLQ